MVRITVDMGCSLNFKMAVNIKVAANRTLRQMGNILILHPHRTSEFSYFPLILSLPGSETVEGRSSVEARSDHELDHASHKELSINDLFIKDAFLVFRALCKLTMKPLNTERYLS
jgi:hypothetical protein